MIILRRGDRLPTVAVLQSYLNQQPTTRPLLSVDGIFGPKTHLAVQRFQSAARLAPNGVADWELWRRVVGEEWQIIDWIDRSTKDLDPNLIPAYGQTVLEDFGTTFGAPKVLKEVAAAGRMGQVVLLRFHGHGGPGRQLVSGVRADGTAFDYHFGANLFGAFRPLRPIFAPFGSVEFHACMLARGKGGRTLLTGVADALGVPASGGINYQYGGYTQKTFRFEGPTVTMCPCGGSLPVWARRAASVSMVRPTTFA